MLSKFLDIVFKMFGWELEKNLPPGKKFVIIAAPHTSNWDFLFFILYVWSVGRKIRWGGKDTLFKPPFGFILKWLGGIPIDRSKKNNFVTRMVEEMNKNEEFVLTITPEGTRSAAKRWRTGFYYIAVGANVPIALGYIDYKNKLLGVGKYFYPSGNIEEDMVLIKDFYKGITGIRADNQGEIEIKTK